MNDIQLLCFYNSFTIRLWAFTFQLLLATILCNIATLSKIILLCIAQKKCLTKKWDNFNRVTIYAQIDKKCKLIISLEKETFYTQKALKKWHFMSLLKCHSLFNSCNLYKKRDFYMIFTWYKKNTFNKNKYLQKSLYRLARFLLYLLSLWQLHSAKSDKSLNLLSEKWIEFHSLSSVSLFDWSQSTWAFKLRKRETKWKELKLNQLQI